MGYQRQLSAEGVLSLKPDVLLGTEEMGPPPVLAQLREAGVDVVVLSASPSLDTLYSISPPLASGSHTARRQLI
ncbi:hypothetical protein ULG90_22115 [Halopseudomonas pachastrellae]|nr:hypothetical protein ULG90_22115 [Halopseudomonas pachastrellae]